MYVCRNPITNTTKPVHNMHIINRNVDYIPRFLEVDSVIKKIGFKNPIKNSEIIHSIELFLGSTIKIPTLKEIFKFLRLREPLVSGERVVCLEKDLQLGDDVLIITESGPVITSCLPVWDTNYKFIVSVSTPDTKSVGGSNYLLVLFRFNQLSSKYQQKHVDLDWLVRSTNH